MKIQYLVRYMMMDFLMEQKGRILRLEEQLKHTENEDRRGLIKAQIAVYFQEGLEALAKFESDTPKSVRDWFMGYRDDKPSFEEITAGRSEDIPVTCPRCKDMIKEIPAGMSKKTGKPYKKFWVCENPACNFTYNGKKDRQRNRYQQDRDIVYIAMAIGIGVLTMLYFFSPH